MLHLTRHWFTDKSVIGGLALDGVKFLWSLEPPSRADKPRCIPVGLYNVSLHPSQRFGKPMPFLEDVEDFVGIMFHPGNFPEDTEGCILVGTGKDVDKVLNSRIAFAELMEKVTFPTTLLIEEQPPVDEVDHYIQHPADAPTTTAHSKNEP